jgi:putative ABC transport system ATP-binding protein
MPSQPPCTGPPNERPLIRIAGLRKAYRSGRRRVPVLDDLDLEVRAGEFIVILGVSGSGKTTLLNLIGGIDRPDGGTLEVCGLSLDAASETELARLRRDAIGFIFQAYNLLPTLTARENVEAALEVTGLHSRSEAGRRAEAILAAVGLAEQAASFPAELSGGEQQRVAVARALAKAPPLVLADEPTGNLDGETGAEVWDLMHRLRRESGAAFLVVTHDAQAAGRADRVFRIRGGQLAPLAHPAGPVDAG